MPPATALCPGLDVLDRVVATAGHLGREVLGADHEVWLGATDDPLEEAPPGVKVDAVLVAVVGVVVAQDLLVAVEPLLPAVPGPLPPADCHHPGLRQRAAPGEGVEEAVGRRVVGLAQRTGPGS